MDSQAVHLVCGSTGAGKTTYALRLTDELGGIRFSLDEWMATLFWMDIPTSNETAWAFARIDRCQEQIWSMVKSLAAHGIPSVLDFGFVRQQDRAAVAKRAAGDKLSIKLHFLDTPVTTRWERVRARNASQAETFKFVISRESFDYTESIWQPPTESELAESNGVRIK